MRFYKQSAEKRLPRTAESCFSAIKRYEITYLDGELFNRAVEKAIEDIGYAYYLSYYKRVTKEDGEIFNKVVERAIEDSRNAYWLLYDRIITRSDGEIFKKAIEKAIENSSYANDLLISKIITRSDGELFDKVVEKAIENSKRTYWLLRDKIITKSDVSPELWEKLLSSAEKHDSDARQKFGGINFRRNSNMRFYKTAGWRVEKVNENDWIIHTPKGYYVDENDKEYHFSTKEKALEELDYLRAEHRYEKKSELGFNANPENEEEERVLEIATELDNACFNAYKANGWNGWGTLEERQRGIDIAKKALAPLVEKYYKELSDDRFFKMLYRHNEDNNYHTENKALEELTGRKRRASMNRKAYYDEYEEEDLNSPEYIYSLLVNGNIAEYKKALNDMTKKELIQYLRWADEMDIDESKLRLHYITASKKVTAENMDLDDVEEDNLSKSDFTDEMGIDDSNFDYTYITKEEWDNTPDDYKMLIDGIRYMMFPISHKNGGKLCPVKIKDASLKKSSKKVTAEKLKVVSEEGELVAYDEDGGIWYTFEWVDDWPHKVPEVAVYCGRPTTKEDNTIVDFYIQNDYVLKFEDFEDASDFLFAVKDVETKQEMETLLNKFSNKKQASKKVAGNPELDPKLDDLRNEFVSFIRVNRPEDVDAAAVVFDYHRGLLSHDAAHRKLRDIYGGSERKSFEKFSELMDVMRYWWLNYDSIYSTENKEASRRKSVNRHNIGKLAYKKKAGGEIVPGVKFIWHGEWADPEIEYNGYIFNYWDVIDALKSWYDEICEDNKEEPTDEGLDAFIEAKIKNELDDYINIGGIGKRIESSNKRTNMKYSTDANKKIARRKKAGESYGWVVDSADAYDALDKFVNAYGTKEALDAIIRTMTKDELSDALAYIFRMYDFREGCSDYEEDEED